MNIRNDMDTDKAFEIGRDVGLEAIEKLAETFDGKHAEHTYKAFAGLMTTVMHCLYFQAPTEEAAEELIATAQAWGKDNASKERAEGKGGAS